MLAVALLAGGFAATVGLARSDQDLETALPPLVTSIEDPAPSWFATTLPEALAPPTTIGDPPPTVGDPPPTLPVPNTVVPGTATPRPTPSPTAPATTRGTAPGGVTATTLRPATATGQAPEGSVPAPAGLRLTLALDAT